MRQTFSFIVGFAIVTLLCLQAYPADYTHEFSVPHGKKLRLAVPVDFTLTTEEGEGLQITIRDPHGDYTLLISTLPLMDKQTEKMFSVELLKYLLLASGKELLKHSIEDRITLLDLEGCKGDAFYFVLSDSRNPLPEGEYPHAAQGMVLLGKLRLAFTILTNNRTDEALQAPLNVLRSARYK